MTQETNAAIEGALEAGATEILVRDSHGSARNILPNVLRPEAVLLRDWSGGVLERLCCVILSVDTLLNIRIVCILWLRIIDGLN